MDSLLCCKGCYTYFTHAEIANLLRLVYSVTHVGHAVTGDSESDSLRDSNPHAGEIKMAAGVLSNVKTRYCEAGAWDSLVMQLRQVL